MKMEKDLQRLEPRECRRQARRILAAFTKIILLAGVVLLPLAACNAPAGKSHFILAERLFNDRKYAAAVEEFAKLVEADPRGTLAQKALFRIGTIQYLYLESYADAIKS